MRIWHALKGVDKPFYVEVGAQHPFVMSPTAALYQLGWRGILVEPDPAFAALLREYRPNDTVIEAGASSEPGELVLSRFESTGLSSFSNDYVALAAQRGMVPMATARVPVRTVDEILTHEGASTVHFLSIDVEGWEHEVLLGVNLAKWQPWVLCIEAIEPGDDTYVGQEVRLLVEGEGYVHVVFDGVNDWFVSAGHLELKPAIQAGFSAIDSGKFGWKRYETWAWEMERAELMARLSNNPIRAAVIDETDPRELPFLAAKRELVAAARAVRRPEPFADSSARVGEEVPHLRLASAPETPSTPVRHVLLRRSTVKRVARVLVPERLRVLRSRRNNFRRFVVANTAPAFVLPKGTPNMARPRPATLLGSVISEGFLAPGLVDEVTAGLIESFLSDHPEDHDERLESRQDGRGDEVGTTLSDLRTRLDLSKRPTGTLLADGTKVLFDARSLQSSGFRDRGIGVFAKALLDALQASLDKSEIVLFVDVLAAPLPDDIRGDMAQISSLNNSPVTEFGLFVQPSPMTHDVAPLVRILRSGLPSVVVVYDFIPAEYPDVYLPAPSDLLRYATQMQALNWYSTFLPISASVEQALHKWIPSSAGHSITAWPADLFAPTSYAAPRAMSKVDQIVIFGANEPRKNTLAALAGIEKATRRKKARPRIVILGMSEHEHIARHWVGLAGLSNSDVVVPSHLPKHERDEILARSTLVLVPSFAEGLSLPVIEALNAGTPVVASRIDTHLELLGDGSHLADPARPEEWARAIARALARPSRLFAKQARTVAHQRKEPLEGVVQRIVERLDLGRAPETAPADPRKPRGLASRPLPSIGIATPWPMQRSGVADYSIETLTALSRIANVTVYATSSVRADRAWNVRPMTDAYDAVGAHDSFVSVLGNSHFHIPMLSLLRHSGGVALAHDSKMVELYAMVEGHTAAANLMNSGMTTQGTTFSITEQIQGNNYGNLGYGEIAEMASAVLFHSPGAAARVREETGKPTHVLPFVPLRQPAGSEPLSVRREAARQYLGFDDDSIHLISIGIIDPRTKLHDLIVEAALWLRMWGHNLHLHFVGSAGGALGAVPQMIERSREGGDDWFHVTGFVPEAHLRRYMSAADLMVQLRTGNVPMLSAPVADAAAFGTPVLASALLREDSALPPFVQSVGGSLSPLTLAERLAAMIADRVAPKQLDIERLEYLSIRNPDNYARELLNVLQELS